MLKLLIEIHEKFRIPELSDKRIRFKAEIGMLRTFKN
jgi:hypothetical protein